VPGPLDASGELEVAVAPEKPPTRTRFESPPEKERKEVSDSFPCASISRDSRHT
jgi:hypothetical protein